MRDVKITVFGKTAMVEAAHVKHFLKKEELVRTAGRLQLVLERIVDFEPAAVIREQLNKTMRQIQRLNRKMRREGMYCQFVD